MSVFPASQTVAEINGALDNADAIAAAVILLDATSALKGTQMDIPHTISRSMGTCYIVVLACLFSIALYFLGPKDLVRHIFFSLFIGGFIFPVCAYYVILLLRDDPILTIRTDSLELHNTFFSWRATELDFDDILSVKPDWMGPDISKHDLVFQVTESCFRKQEKPNVWNKKKHTSGNYFLVLEFSHARKTPPEAASIINAILSDWKKRTNQMGQA